jgi:hypothetical protein
MKNRLYNLPILLLEHDIRVMCRLKIGQRKPLNVLPPRCYKCDGVFHVILKNRKQLDTRFAQLCHLNCIELMLLGCAMARNGAH